MSASQPFILFFDTKGGLQRIHYHGRVISYTHKRLGEIAWNRMPTKLIAESVPDEMTEQVPLALLRALTQGRLLD